MSNISYMDELTHSTLICHSLPLRAIPGGNRLLLLPVPLVCHSRRESVFLCQERPPIWAPPPRLAFDHEWHHHRLIQLRNPSSRPPPTKSMDMSLPPLLGKPRLQPWHSQTKKTAGLQPLGYALSEHPENLVKPPAPQKDLHPSHSRPLTRRRNLPIYPIQPDSI